MGFVGILRCRLDSALEYLHIRICSIHSKVTFYSYTEICWKKIKAATEDCILINHNCVNQQSKNSNIFNVLSHMSKKKPQILTKDMYSLENDWNN